MIPFRDANPSKSFPIVTLGLILVNALAFFWELGQGERLDEALFPHARIQTLVPLFLYYEIMELPAILVLGFWFIAQLLNGTAAIAATTSGAGVAWWAHVGGFLAGAVLLFLLSSGQNQKTRI